MRGQHENSKFGLLFNHGITVRSSWDYTEAQIVAIAFQVLFEWIKEYIEKANITDGEGNKFVVPAFQYSSADFERDFPEWGNRPS